MAKFYDHIDDKIQTFIEKQPIFFVATARAEGSINLSPKGLDTLRILDQNTVVWLNLTGSGNETAAHLLENDRITIMFCAFEGKPLILRLYGTAKVYHEQDDFYKEHLDKFPPSKGARQIISVKVERVQTSCGYAVPLMDLKEERDILTKWVDHKSKEGIRDYWREKNTKSIDGFDTGMDFQ
jgi:predicted pyridoxine 5'-phosphate oxidase superfamily flavin-nucleotide-binding protein